CKYGFPLLRKQGGAIVNLSSVLGLIGSANLPAYSASKGGVSLLTKSVALHGARYKPPVRCNAVCPAFIEGPMVDGIAQGTRDPEAVRNRLSSDIPLGRLGAPEEVAKLCVYLLSDDSSFITGADVPIDGGLTAR
ncbi:MAG: SDR family oxidoreductase, partial [Pseudolabrys sp.]